MAEPRRGRPRAEPRDDQRARIVAAARAAFAERGYDAVSMSGIADAARVPRAIVYDVVGTKEALLGAVADELATELIAAIDAHFDREDDPDQPLDELVRADVGWILELLASDPAYPPLIQTSGRVASTQEPAARARARIEDRITELHVRRAEAYGLDRAATARVLSVVMLAVIESAAVRAMREGWPMDAVADLVTEYATGGYLRSEDNAAATFEERMGDGGPDRDPRP